MYDFEVTVDVCVILALFISSALKARISGSFQITIFGLRTSLAFTPCFNVLGPISRVWSLQTWAKLNLSKLRLDLSELNISNYASITLFPGIPPL